MAYNCDSFSITWKNIEIIGTYVVKDFSAYLYLFASYLHVFFIFATLAALKAIA